MHIYFRIVSLRVMDKRVDWKDRKMSVAMSTRMQEVLRNGMSANHEILRRKGHNP